MINLEKICHGQPVMGSFYNLRRLKLRTCHKLGFVFSLSMVRCFSQLQEIEICGCGVMSALIAKLREDEIQIGDVTMDIRVSSIVFLGSTISTKVVELFWCRFSLIFQ